MIVYDCRALADLAAAAAADGIPYTARGVIDNVIPVVVMVVTGESIRINDLENLCVSNPCDRGTRSSLSQTTLKVRLGGELRKEF